MISWTALPYIISNIILTYGAKFRFFNFEKYVCRRVCGIDQKLNHGFIITGRLKNVSVFAWIGIFIQYAIFYRSSSEIYFITVLNLRKFTLHHVLTKNPWNQFCFLVLQKLRQNDCTLMEFFRNQFHEKFWRGNLVNFNELKWVVGRAIFFCQLRDKLSRWKCPGFCLNFTSRNHKILIILCPSDLKVWLCNCYFSLLLHTHDKSIFIQKWLLFTSGQNRWIHGKKFHQDDDLTPVIC